MCVLTAGQKDRLSIHKTNKKREHDKAGIESPAWRTAFEMLKILWLCLNAAQCLKKKQETKLKKTFHFPPVTQFLFQKAL